MAITTSRPDPAEAPLVVDAEALIAEARQRQRLRWKRARYVLMALALAAGAAVVAVNRLDGGPSSPTRGDTGRTLSDAEPATPAMSVAWLSDQSLVVLNGRTGRVIRTLAPDVGLEEPGLPNLSVSSGGIVFFDNVSAAPFVPATASGGDQIYRVPIGGGPVTHLAAGYDPQVSPDGRTLAFLAPEVGGEDPYLDAAGGIEIAQVTPTGITGLRILHPDASQLNLGISQLSWSPDSGRISFSLYNGQQNSTTFWQLDLSGGSTSLGPAQEIPISNPSLTWNGFWGHRIDGSYVGLGLLTGSNGAQHVVTVDPKSGRVISSLFSVPGRICVTRSAPVSLQAQINGSSPCVSNFNDAVSGDASGTDVLVAGSTHVQASTGQQSTPYLYRWRIGGDSLVKLTPTALIATWGPQRH
jgi:hypothetical protein